jgi:hypothetical protein
VISVVEVGRTVSPLRTSEGRTGKPSLGTGTGVSVGLCTKLIVAMELGSEFDEVIAVVGTVLATGLILGRGGQISSFYPA